MKMKFNNIYLIIGKSGSGKSTICRKVIEQFRQHGYPFFSSGLILKSYTTRKKRAENDTDHVFISDKEFKNREKDMVALTEYDGEKYGATLDNVKHALLYTLDNDGYTYFKNNCSYTDYVSVYIDADETDRTERLVMRGDDPESVKDRIAFDRTWDMTENMTDYIVSNSKDISYAVNEVCKIISYHENLPHPYKKRIYISHPYEGKKENKEEVEDIIKKLQKRYPTYLFYSPIHMNGFLYDSTDYKDGLLMCTDLLNFCDELWMTGDWINSYGCMKELSMAKELNSQWLLNKSIKIKILKEELND